MPDGTPISVATEEEIDNSTIPLGLMQRDLIEVANLSTDEVEKISNLLMNENGVLSDESLGELIKDVVGTDKVEGIVRVIRNILPENKPQILKLIKRSAEKKPSLFSDSLDQLLTNLDILVREYPVLRILRKAKQLSRDTGNELIQAFFACDLRPVFDEAHSHIDAFVCLANLKLNYFRQSGISDVFEVSLTEDELYYLKKKIEDALSKIETMKSSVRNVLPVRGEL